MAIRNILDYQNNIVGQLELPDDTSEVVWERELALYSQAPIAVEIPDVTPRQIRQALILSGIALADIETALDSLPEPSQSLARVEWEYSVAFQRSRPLVVQMGAMLGFTSEQLDALWALAKTL